MSSDGITRRIRSNKRISDKRGSSGSISIRSGMGSRGMRINSSSMRREIDEKM
jgi:hypothetical protein